MFDAPRSPWLSTEEVAELLGIEANTLRTWRETPGKGPAFSRVSSRIVRYHIMSIEAWLRSFEVKEAAAVAA